MQVLSVTPEIFPLIKTGGLADVTGALPIALAAKGVTMSARSSPAIPQVMECLQEKEGRVYQYPLLQGGKAKVLVHMPSRLPGLRPVRARSRRICSNPPWRPLWRNAAGRGLARQLAALRSAQPGWR